MNEVWGGGCFYVKLVFNTTGMKLPSAGKEDNLGKGKQKNM